MTNNKVTLKDVYEAINSLEAKIDKRYETRFKHLEVSVDENTTFRNQLIGKMTVVFAIIGISVNWIWDYFINNK